MRRNYNPFNGKRFVLNTNTGEIHDLDNETENCKINEISKVHVYAGDTYEDVEIYEIFNTCPSCNGCHWCIPSKDEG